MTRLDIPIGELFTGDITWKDYINSLSPEELEKQRQYDRARVKKYYQENKEERKTYGREYYQKNKEKIKEQRRNKKASAASQAQSHNP